MATSFQEFLHKKVEGTDWNERKRRRKEWTVAVNRLLDQIRDFLRESDPENLIEVLPYTVQRVEGSMGVYEAPALSIRLGTDTVEVVPSDRYARLPLALQDLLATSPGESRWGGLSGGRVDITDGERRHILLRGIEDGQDHWYALQDRTSLQPIPFDRNCLESLLQDLLR